MRKLTNSTVELEGGKLMQKPSFLFGGDCRACALLDLVCEELETPCTGLLRECEKREKERRCEECEQLEPCLGEKLCCWLCLHLKECLEMARESGGEEFVKCRYGCGWEEFEAALKMLAEGEEGGFKADEQS
jgi:hypothetical protein